MPQQSAPVPSNSRQAAAMRWQVNWGHLALLSVIAAVVVAYLLDARGVSVSLENLLFVQPGAVLALVLCALVLPQCFRRVAAGDEVSVAARDRAEERARLINTGLLTVLFGAFATSLETVGFDVACWVFLCLALVVCGERRWWVVLLFATLFTLVLIAGFRRLIPFPFPLTVL